MVLVRALAALVALRTASARTVEWHGIDATIKGRSLLRSISGRAEPGRLHAIMGPSGSGKSTLLCAIAGCCDRKVGLRGDLRLDGAAVDRVDAAFVRQQDVFYPYLTVRETLTFAATLRLGRDADVPTVVDDLLRKTGLGKAADSIVGDDKVRGVSGGERKRLAIACELVDDPAVLFLDEPTSGLDSFAAARVVASLRGLCDAGTTVVCVIHQPSGKVFGVRRPHAAERGRAHVPRPAARRRPRARAAGREAAGLLVRRGARGRGVSVDYSSAETEARAARRSRASRPRRARPRRPRRRRRRRRRPRRRRRRARRGGPRELRLLYQRRGVSRAKAATAIKAAQQVMTALIYGGIYDLDDSQRSIQDRFGLLSLCVAAELPLAAGLSCLAGPCSTRAKLRRSAQAFRTFLGIQVLNSLASGALGLLVGAVGRRRTRARALPPLIVLMIIFNGSNISDESTPKPIKFLPKLSLVRWGFEGLAVNEFDGLYFECQNRREDLRTGRDALARLAFEDSTVKKACVAQAAILGGCYLQTYRALRSSRPAFAVMKPTRR
ncbi:ATPase [Aureococcus anophagefferens]|nr:ATPase [Aureococcus anophagefferens]